jgi:hypothetical protein
MEDGAKQITLTLGPREIAVFVVGGTLEAAVWPQMEDIPHWLRNVHILIAAPLLLSLLVQTKFAWFKWVQATLGLAYLATVGYILSYSKEFQDWLWNTGPRYSWLTTIVIACVLVASGVLIGFLYFRREIKLRKWERHKITEDYIRETDRLKKELEELRMLPPAGNARVSPSDKENLVWIWRKMASDVQRLGGLPAKALAAHQDCPSLRPYLTPRTKDAIEGLKDAGELYPSTMHPVMQFVLDDIERIVRLWGLADTVGDGLTLRSYEWPVFRAEISADDAGDDPNIVYKKKIRIRLRNVAGKLVQAWTPLWESDQVPLQGILPGARFRVQGEDGKWLTDKWRDGSIHQRELPAVGLNPGDICDCWMGLAPREDQSISEMVRTGSYIGTALFPVKIDGKLYMIPVKC